MTTETTETGGAPAGVEPVSEISAADQIAAILGDDPDFQDDEPQGQPEPTEDERDGERAAAPEPESDEDGDAQADDAPDQESEPSNKVRLRDGTEVEIGELNKAYAAQREFEQRQQQFNAEAQKVAQQQQFFQQVLPQAIALLEQNVPPEPDPELLRTDPISHYEQTIARQQAIGKLQQMQQAQATHQQQQSHVQKQYVQQYVAREREQLIEKMPELKDPAKRQEFGNRFVETAKSYGFRDDEIANAFDHRLVLLARDAAAYRELQASKPVAEKKTSNASPVVRPGKRVSPSEQASRERSEKMKQLRETGSPNLAAALIADLID